jgi:hypothetical protein
MHPTFSILLTLTLGLTLAGCNRSPVQTAPAPSVNTSLPTDQIPPAQDTNVRVDADRRDVDIKVDRPGLLGDRKIEVTRDSDGDVRREVTRDRDVRPLRDREIDIQVTPGQGVKVDLDK